MSIADNLSVFELPKAMVEPSVRACRMFNTMLDVIFYSTGEQGCTDPKKTSIPND
jgi:hypothetical protein